MVQPDAVSPVDRHYFKLMTAVVAVIGLLLAAVLAMKSTVAREFLGEGGVIETLAAGGYIVCVASLIREGGFRWVGRHFYFAAIVVAMCLRELDFHSNYTTMSITKSSFYVAGHVPLGEKLGAVLVLGFLIVCGVVMVRRHGRSFFKGLRNLDAVALAIAAAGLSAVAAKSLDGIGRKLGEIGLIVPESVEMVSLAIEEVLELGIPAFAALAVFAYFTSRNGHFRERQV